MKFLSFNPLTSKTILGALIAVVIYLSGAAADGLTAQEIGGAVAAMLTALGLRDAAAKGPAQ